MRKKKGIFFCIFILITLTTYNFYSDNRSFSTYFNLKKIEVSGISNIQEEQIMTKLNVLKGKNIISINKKKISTIVKDFSYIEKIIVKKIYPDKIKIIITELDPIGIFLEENKKLILLQNGSSTTQYNQKNLINLLSVYGVEGDKNFYIFYNDLIKTSFDITFIKEVRYFKTKRWDIILKNDKLIRLPIMDYNKSLIKFNGLSKKDEFKNFKIFDFRVNGQLFLK